MVLVSNRLQLIALALSGALLLTACSKKLDEQQVRDFIDAADQAFLKGSATQMCALRSKDFRLEATSFELAKGKTAESLEDAEAIEAESAASGGRGAGSTEVLDLEKFCFMAIEAKNLYKRVNMQRGELHIDIDASGQKAAVRAHYSVTEPVYAYQESALHDNDRVEQQVASRQTESDDESVVVIGPDGDLLFESTRSVSKSFLVAKVRDRRL